LIIAQGNMKMIYLNYNDEGFLTKQKNESFKNSKSLHLSSAHKRKQFLIWTVKSLLLANIQSINHYLRNKIKKQTETVSAKKVNLSVSFKN
jgi:hypothetical protein